MGLTINPFVMFRDTGTLENAMGDVGTGTFQCDIIFRMKTRDDVSIKTIRLGLCF